MHPTRREKQKRFLLAFPKWTHPPSPASSPSDGLLKLGDFGVAKAGDGWAAELRFFFFLGGVKEWLSVFIFFPPWGVKEKNTWLSCFFKCSPLLCFQVQMEKGPKKSHRQMSVQ